MEKGQRAAGKDQGKWQPATAGNEVTPSPLGGIEAGHSGDGNARPAKTRIAPGGGLSPTGRARRRIQANRCSGCVWRDAWSALGAFLAPAPWRGFQAPPSIFRARMLGGACCLVRAWRFLCARTVARGFKQRPQCFGRGWWVGRDAWFALGAFLAPAQPFPTCGRVWCFIPARGGRGIAQTAFVTF
jgi:hypothetical protein